MAPVTDGAVTAKDGGIGAELAFSKYFNSPPFFSVERSDKGLMP